MFPINIKYKREFNVHIESTKTLDLIEKELIAQKIDKIERSDLQINFKNSFSNGQGKWHLMAPIDKGYVRLDMQPRKLEYSISFIRTFYISSAMSLLFGLVSQSYWIGIIFFVWFFGMNWIITIIRQSSFANKLKSKLIEKNTTHNKL